MDEPRFNDDGTLNDRRHKDDHHWLGQEIDRRKKRDEMKEKVKTSIITSIIFSILTSLGAVVWYAFVTFVQNGGIK